MTINLNNVRRNLGAAFNATVPAPTPAERAAAQAIAERAVPENTPPILPISPERIVQKKPTSTD